MLGLSKRGKARELKSFPKSSRSPVILSSSLCTCLLVFSQSRSLHDSFSDFLSPMRGARGQRLPSLCVWHPSSRDLKNHDALGSNSAFLRKPLDGQPGGPLLGQSTWACFKPSTSDWSLEVSARGCMGKCSRERSWVCPPGAPCSRHLTPPDVGTPIG